MNESQAGSKTVLIETLDRHITRLRKFLSLFEAMRWKFLSGFGIGALAGTLLAIVRHPESRSLTWVGGGAVLALSLAGLITQIRIYGIVHCIALRIRSLQEQEVLLLSERFPTLHQGTTSFLLPRICCRGKPLSHLLTVHMACCLVFSTLAATGVVIAALQPRIAPTLAAVFGFVSLLALLVVCWFVTVWYVEHLQREEPASDGKTEE